MNASKLLEIYKGKMAEGDALAKVKAAIEAGKATDDLGITKGTASAYKAELIAAGMDEADADADAKDAIAKGIVTDDLGVADVDRIEKAVAAARADIAKASQDLVAAVDGDDGGDPVVLDFAGQAEAIRESADKIVKGALSATDGIAKAVKDHGVATSRVLEVVVVTMGELAKSVARLGGDMALVKGGVASVKQELGRPVAPRLTVVHSPFDEPRTAAPAGPNFGELAAKGYALMDDAGTPEIVKGKISAAINDADVDTLAKLLKAS